MKDWPLPQTSQSSPEPLPDAGRRPDHFRIINSSNPSVQVSEVCAVLTSTLRIRELRHREVERFALGHTAGQLKAQEGRQGWWWEKSVCWHTSEVWSGWKTHRPPALEEGAKGVRSASQGSGHGLLGELQGQHRHKCVLKLHVVGLA